MWTPARVGRQLVAFGIFENRRGEIEIATGIGALLLVVGTPAHGYFSSPARASHRRQVALGHRPAAAPRRFLYRQQRELRWRKFRPAQRPQLSRNSGCVA